MPSRFKNPNDGSYRDHSQVHKSKNKYKRRKSIDLKGIDIEMIDEEFSIWEVTKEDE